MSSLSDCSQVLDTRDGRGHPNDRTLKGCFLKVKGIFQMYHDSTKGEGEGEGEG